MPDLAHEHDRRHPVLYPTVLLNTGGAEQQLLELVRGLDKRRFRPIVAPLYPGGALEDQFRAVPDAEVVCLDRRGKADPSVLWRLTSLIRARRVEIVQPFVSPASFFGLLTGILARGTATVATERSGVRRYRGLGARGYQAAENSLLRFVDAAVANSEAGGHLLRRSGVHPSRARVIANGVNPQRLQVDPARVASHRQRLGATADAPVVGILANLTPAKDHQSFLRAAAVIAEHQPDARFAVVGDGPLRSDLEALARQLGLQERVTFFGFQSRVADFLGLFSVLVSSSRDNEGHSNSILEAMALGVPVVATDIGGNRELVQQGRTGLLVPGGQHQALSSAVLTVLRSSDLAHTLRANARAMIDERFTLERMVGSYEHLYCELLGVELTARSDHRDSLAPSDEPVAPIPVSAEPPLHAHAR